MKKYICTRCGTQIESTEKEAPGTSLPSIIFWLFILAPCLFGMTGMAIVFFALWLTYIIIRHRLAPYCCSACPSCKSQEVISIDSPIGQKLAEQLKDE